MRKPKYSPQFNAIVENNYVVKLRLLQSPERIKTRVSAMIVTRFRTRVNQQMASLPANKPSIRHCRQTSGTASNAVSEEPAASIVGTRQWPNRARA